MKSSIKICYKKPWYVLQSVIKKSIYIVPEHFWFLMSFNIKSSLWKQNYCKTFANKCF